MYYTYKTYLSFLFFINITILFVFFITRIFEWPFINKELLNNFRNYQFLIDFYVFYIDYSANYTRTFVHTMDHRYVERREQFNESRPIAFVQVTVSHGGPCSSFCTLNVTNLKKLIKPVQFFGENEIANFRKRKRNDRRAVVFESYRSTDHESFGRRFNVLRWIQLANIHGIGSSDHNISS